MTLNEISKELVNELSVDGFINREKFTASRLNDYLKSLFKGSLKLKDKAILEIALPDGWWYMSVVRYSGKPDGYDYYIPDTRGEEKTLIESLFA